MLNERTIAIAKGMILRGDPGHHIASLIGENSARIYELKQGIPSLFDPNSPTPIRGADIEPWPLEKLPPPGPYFLNMVAERDIIQAGCELAVEQIALFIGRLERDRPVDEAALQEAQAARAAIHNALLERRRENYKGVQR